MSPAYFKDMEIIDSRLKELEHITNKHELLIKSMLEIVKMLRDIIEENYK